MNESESDARWKIYLSGTGGVAIRSNISRLKRCFEHSGLDIYLGKIAYIGSDHLGDGFDMNLRRFMRKKLAFRHEREVRLVYYDEHKNHPGKSGTLIPIDVPELIDKIVISPRAEEWFLPLVKSLVTKLGFAFDGVPSEGAEPLPI